MRRLDAIHMAIWRFVVEWSDLEYCLDLLVLAARTRASNKPLPHQFKAKLTFLKDSSNSQSRLHMHANAIMALVEEACSMQDTRHDYVHGAIINMAEEARPLAVTLHRMLQPPKNPRRHPVQVTARQINLAADEARRLADKILDMAEAVNKVPQSN